MSGNDDILCERRGRLALVTLNRPAALNALTLGMIRALDRSLSQWERDAGVGVVAVVGAGERAFCAGGDVRALYDAGLSGDGDFLAGFYREEYRLNHRLHAYAKPYVAFLNGLAMGGGVGVSVHGSHRVACERSAFAMPEVFIGFFPDVGGTWFLPRCPGRIGTYLALTGTRIGPADMVAAGIATHYVPAERWPAALAALEKIGAGPKAKQEATAALEAFAAPAPGPCLLAEHRAEIDRVFAAATVEEMLAALDAEPGAWAGETAAAMRRASPTSLKVALAALRQGARLDLKAALKVEYRLSQYFMRGPEFFEGVRAAVIDKDRRPRWQPDSLAGVDAAAVDRAFAGGAETELGFE